MGINNIILDFGHGGCDKNGKYTTYPNKMFVFDDHTIAYEGQINREIGFYIYDLCKKNLKDKHIICTVDYDNPSDISLKERVRIVNKYPKKETILLSIHNNASENHLGSGFEIYTTKGNTKADKLAECIADEIERLYSKFNISLRYDLSDGDKDKEADFYILKNTKCPAVLIEFLFFDNKKDIIFLKDKEFQQFLALSVFDGIKKFMINEDL